MVDLSEPQDETKDMAVKDSTPEPKEKKRSSDLQEEKEAEFEREPLMQMSSSPIDSMVQARIIESVIADIKIEHNPPASEHMNAPAKGSSKKPYLKPPSIPQEEAAVVEIIRETQ